MPRIFKYDNRELPDPNPSLSIDDVRQNLTSFYPELANADTDVQKRGDDEIITFKKRVGTKGYMTRHGTTKLRSTVWLVDPELKI